jgi:hypothetical protein
MPDILRDPDKTYPNTISPFFDAKVKRYNRQAALDYAAEWVFKRNPKFADFENMGGDCSNFISQCLLAGGGLMTTNAKYSWYYNSMNSRSPSWSGVPFLENFLITNKGRGPFGAIVPLSDVMLGDIVQLKFAGHSDFSHSLLVTRLGNPVGENDIHSIFITCHSIDSQDRPLDSYSYLTTRAVHIEGVRQ